MGTVLTQDARSGTLRLLVIDDHPVVREGVTLLVQHDPTLEVVGYARNGAEATEVARVVSPDVILLDLRLPDMLAPEVARRVRELSPATRIVVFTAYTDHAALGVLRDAGVDGCLLKDASPTDFVDALHRVAAGEQIFDHRISGAPLERQPNGITLTPREYEVLRRAAMGESNPEIAAAIGLSRNTVKAYLQSVMQKLGARNRVEAIAKANEAGLL